LVVRVFRVVVGARLLPPPRVAEPLETVRVGPTCRLLVGVLAAPPLKPVLALVLELETSPVGGLALPPPVPLFGVVVVPLFGVVVVPPLSEPAGLLLPPEPAVGGLLEPEPEPPCEPLPGSLPPPFGDPLGAGLPDGGGVLCPPLLLPGALGACGTGPLGALDTGAGTVGYEFVVGAGARGNR
jgi:hypothetical protein